MSLGSGPPRRPGIKLGVEQVDLLLLHQALPSQFEKTLQACPALETLFADGTVRAIGIPKATRPERIAENIDVFEVKLTDDELAVIDGLDTGQALPAGRSRRPD
jgi:diketogulonate reductase-like aldo/keto reductase